MSSQDEEIVRWASPDEPMPQFVVDLPEDIDGPEEAGPEAAEALPAANVAPRRRGARAVALQQDPMPAAPGCAEERARASKAAPSPSPRAAVVATPRPGGRTPGAAKAKFPERARSPFSAGGATAVKVEAPKAKFDLPSRWAQTAPPGSGRRAPSQPAPTSGALLQRRREATLSKQSPPSSARRGSETNGTRAAFGVGTPSASAFRSSSASAAVRFKDAA